MTPLNVGYARRVDYMHTVSLDLGESAASGSLAAETAVSVLTAEPAAPC